MLTWVPNGGAARTFSVRKSMTWLTESATTPITVGSPSKLTSTITMHVRSVTGLATRPNLNAKSTTGTTLPRRLMTPRIDGGVCGTLVSVPYGMISFTRRMPMAYSSPAK